MRKQNITRKRKVEKIKKILHIHKSINQLSNYKEKAVKKRGIEQGPRNSYLHIPTTRLRLKSYWLKRKRSSNPIGGYFESLSAIGHWKTAIF